MTSLEDTQKVFSGSDVEVLSPTSTALSTLDDDIRHRLPVFEEARTAIAKAVTIDECLEWDSLIDAAKAYAYKTKQTQMSMDMAKLDLYNHRRLGEVVVEMRQRGLLTKQGCKKGSVSNEVVEAIFHAKGLQKEIARKYGVTQAFVSDVKSGKRGVRVVRSLKDFGVSARQSNVAKRIAALPADKLDEWVSERERTGKPINKTNSLYFANQYFADNKTIGWRRTDAAYQRPGRLREMWGSCLPSEHLTFLKWAIENCAPTTYTAFMGWLSDYHAQKYGAGKKANRRA